MFFTGVQRHASIPLPGRHLDRMNEDHNKWIGKSVPRLEDPPLVTGRGRFAGDISLPASAAHARRALAATRMAGIVAIDADGGARAAGRRRGVDRRRHRRSAADRFPRRGRTRSSSPIASRCWRSERVRYVGEPVAAVFAEDPYVAEDAAELVAIEIEELPRRSWPPTRRRASSRPAAAPKPRCCTRATATSRRPSRAAHTIVELDLSIGRHSGVPLETRGAIARYDAARDVLELHGAAKVPHRNRETARAHARTQPVIGASARGPRRRRLRHPRRALSRGRAGLRRRAAARPAGEMDRGPARASDRRQSLAPAAPSRPRRGRRATAASSASTTSSSTTRAPMCAPTARACRSAPRHAAGPLSRAGLSRGRRISASPTRRRPRPIARPAATRAPSCASA